MPPLLDLSDFRQNCAILDAARRVQFSPVLPDGSTTDRMWATYAHAVMERMLTCFGIVYPMEVVLNGLNHLRSVGELVLPTTDEHDEKWFWK